ncbi:MAG: hypothetical protein LW808_002065 [Verrucomicrobiota bacterium]|nr:MAG: hypothetical protein LW808_002065 [Verrucomicrobiota bacterium]
MGEMIGGVSRWQAARLTSAIERKNREACGGKFKMSSTTIGQFFKLKNGSRASVEANIERFGLSAFKAGKFNQEGFEKAWENEQKQVKDGMKVVNDFVHGSYDIKSSASAYVNDLNQLVQDNQHVMTQVQINQFNQMLADIKELKKNLNLFVGQNLLKNDPKQVNNDKEKLRVLQNVIQEIPKRIESFKKEVEQTAAKYQAALKNKCNDFQTKLNQCYEQINDLEERYEAELSQKCELMTAEFNELEKLIGNETDPEKKAQLQDQLKVGYANLREAQRGAVIDLENAAYRKPSDFANPLQGIEDAIRRLGHAKPSKDFEKSPDFQKVSEFFANTDQSMGQIKEDVNRKISRLQGKMTNAETALSGLKQYAQSLPQTKLDRFKAKQEEWNKNFDEICAHHEAALKAFATLALDDPDFQKALEKEYGELETYKTETRQEFALGVEQTIKEYEAQLEQLKIGDSRRIQDIEKFCKDIDQNIGLLSRIAPQGRSEKKSLSRLKASTSTASWRQLNAFNTAIKTNVEKANAIHAQHVQTAEDFKGAIDNLLSDGKTLPDNIQSLYDAFVKASDDLQAGIQETSRQAKSVYSDCYSAKEKFRTADVTIDHEVIQKFAEVHKRFKSDSDEVKKKNQEIEPLQQACMEKLSALETELLKTPAGCRILIDRDKAQIDRSIGYAATLAEITRSAVEPSDEGELESTEGQELLVNLEQLQELIEQSKQKIEQAYNSNVAGLNGTNEDFAQNYEAFHKVCQEIKEMLGKN